MCKVSSAESVNPVMTYSRLSGEPNSVGTTNSSIPPTSKNILLPMAHVMGKPKRGIVFRCQSESALSGSLRASRADVPPNLNGPVNQDRARDDEHQVWSSVGAVGAFSFTDWMPFSALALDE